MRVCLGKIGGAKVMAHQLPRTGTKAGAISKTTWPSIRCTLQRFPGKGNIIMVRDAEGKDFGSIDARVALGLCPLMDTAHYKIRTSARLDARSRKAFELPGQQTSGYMNISITLYAPRQYVEVIGGVLGKRHIQLQTPLSSDPGVEILNPHSGQKAPKSAAWLKPRTYTTAVTRTQEEMQDDINNLFDSIEHSEKLPFKEPDDTIVTPLLDHQKQALHFLISRENPKDESTDGSAHEPAHKSLWRKRIRSNGNTAWYNVITGDQSHTELPPVLGGILADTMGLGKTLSILSLVCSTLQEAAEWADIAPIDTDVDSTIAGVTALTNVKATLLVCPLSVISNWETQIATHVQPDTLKVYVYHGPNRNSDPEFLSDFDVIISTYSTATADTSSRFKKKRQSPFLSLKFFRIVLDEAHVIREQSTLMSQAICRVAATRRWALTGTPIQNRLDDLGALIKFLRVQPFDNYGVFSNAFIRPFKGGDPQALPHLRLLVDTLTLRRLKDKIDLPQRTETLVELEFSDDEQRLYTWFAKDASNRLQAMNSGKGAVQSKMLGKAYHHILRIILCLRLISAHGRELINEDDLKLIEGNSLSNAIDVDADEKPALNSRQAYEMYSLFSETTTDTCGNCRQRLTLDETTDETTDDEKDAVFGTMLPCFHLICNDCHASVEKKIRTTAKDGTSECPFCEEVISLSFFELTLQGKEDAEEAREKARRDPKKAKMMGRYTGPHTKTIALLEQLHQSRSESQSKPDEPPIKSVIFSGWTTHLDLIQIALEEAKFKFVRIDGKMNLKQRRDSISTFDNDPETTVILISIMAGGLGLNLCVANRVYVMEPQHNPAAEEQAVDRVHRLGQKRDVVITRFIMKNSIEEYMLKKQEAKKDLAKLSLTRQKVGRAEAANARWKELAGMFR